MQIEIPLLSLRAFGSSPGMIHNPLGGRVGVFIFAMYAKVFSQIFDSSIADDFRLRHFFMDLLVLADVNGVVDMTPTAIAARTRIPLENVSSMLSTLEEPDKESRTPEAEGRRIERLDDHRTWGWHIINYDKFRKTASEEQRREKTRIRVANFKAKRQQIATGNALVTHGNAPLTVSNAGNAMQKQKQKQNEEASSKSHSPLAVTMENSEHHTFIRAWSVAFKAFFGFDYEFVPRDAKAVQSLLKLGITRLDLLAIAGDAWKRLRDDRFASNCKKASTIFGFKDSFTQIRVELKNANTSKPITPNHRDFGMSQTPQQTSARIVAELKARGGQ